MSFIVRGMEMPGSCIQCFFCSYNGKESFCFALRKPVIPLTDTLPDVCPLVPVPPHGRLIAADAFAVEMKKRQEEAEKWLREAKDRETAVRADAVLSFLCEVKLTLDAAPTIIEAEGEE